MDWFFNLDLVFSFSNPCVRKPFNNLELAIDNVFHLANEIILRVVLKTFEHGILWFAIATEKQTNTNENGFAPELDVCVHWKQL